MRALGGAPDADTAPTIRDGRMTGWSALRTDRDARTAGQIPRATTTASATAAPPRSSKGSNWKPGSGSASRASPTGVKTDNAAARSTAPTTPTKASSTVRTMVNVKSCRRVAPTARRTG